MQYFQKQSSLALGNGIYRTAMEGLYFIEQNPNVDERGWYSELSKLKEIEQAIGHPFVIEQINLSYSKTNVIRGFHAENWGKLLFPISGECLSVLADFRPQSSTFKQTLAFEMGKNGQMSGSIFIPPGIGNSFLVTKGPLYYLYCVNALYKERDKIGDIAISLFDEELNIDWPISREKMIISQRDLNSTTLKLWSKQNNSSL